MPDSWAEPQNGNSHYMFLRSIRSTYQFFKGFFDPSQPSYLILYVTNQCNFRCDFCFYHKEIARGPRSDELTLAEIARISQRLGPVIQLSLTGGEPFLRQDLDEITLLFAKNNYVRYLTVPTNASLPQPMVRYLEKVLPRCPDTYFRLVFSIDGIGEDHDRYRQAPGSYQKIIKSYQAILPLKKRFSNLVLDANTVFIASNQDKILETLKAIDEAFDFDNMSVTYVRGDIKSPDLKKISFQRYLEANEFLENIRRKKEKRFLYPLWRAVRDISREHLIRIETHGEYVTPCVAGRKLLVIRESGDVQPCEILDKTFGNVRECDYDVHALLARKQNRALRKGIVDSRCRCTFECALVANVLWSRPDYIRLLRKAVKNFGKTD